MTLREFIEQERRECHVFDIEEFGEKLTGLKSEIVDENGSPSGKKYFLLFNPYAIESKKPSTHKDTVKLFNTFLENDFQTICFETSRKMAELTALTSKKELKVKLPELCDKITAYRAGYTVEERKKIEDQLKDGKIKVSFKEKQRAITKGQAVVLYDGDTVVGGGTII